MSSDSIQQLIRIPVFPSCPLVSHGRKHRSHGMIGVSGHPTFRSKRKHDVRPKLPYVLDEVSHDFVEINPMQLPVRIIENHAAINAQNLARRRKLLSANGRQFVIGFRQPTMRAGLSGGQADHIDFGAALVIKPQTPAKSSRFVIRMRGNAKYAWHPKIVSEVRVGADASSAQPERSSASEISVIWTYVASASSKISSSSPSSSMKLNTSCGTGAFQTGANDWRCSGDGPCSRNAAK